MTLFVFENVEEPPPRKIFTILGVDYCTTARWWLNLPLMIVFGIVIAFLIAPVASPVEKFVGGVVYGLLIILSSFCHGLGHVISSKMVNAPVTALISTATVTITHYDDIEEQPSRVHVSRALGGPVLNLLLGVVAAALYLAVAPNHFLLFFGIVNLGFGIFTLLPIPSVDGAVIWHELRNWRK